MALSREDILQADDIEQEEVEVPEWGGGVIVEALSGEERSTFRDNHVKVDPNNPEQMEFKQKDSEERLVALCAVDEDGERLFKPEDVKRLRKKSSRALDRVASKARELSGLEEEDQEEAKKN